MKQKRYIVRKYIMATSAHDALKKDQYFKADECWVDEKWIEQQNQQNPSAIGFAVERDNQDDW